MAIGILLKPHVFYVGGVNLSSTDSDHLSANDKIIPGSTDTLLSWPGSDQVMRTWQTQAAVTSTPGRTRTANV